jgi:hypothetical protein
MSDVTAWGYDDERKPTTVAEYLVVEGIRLTSRYRKADELRLMHDVVLRLPPGIQARLASVFCDTKACATYSLVMKPGLPVGSDDARAVAKWGLERLAKAEAELVAEAFAEGVIALDGGYNFISVGAPSEDGNPFFGDAELAYLNPYWGEENCDPPAA